MFWTKLFRNNGEGLSKFRLENTQVAFVQEKISCKGWGQYWVFSGYTHMEGKSEREYFMNLQVISYTSFLF